MGSPLKAEEVKPVVNQVSPLIAETAEGQIRYERQLPLQKSGVSGISNPKCDLFNAPRSVACVGSYEGRQPRNGFERTVMGATTLLLNEGDQIVNDPSVWAQKKAAYWAVAEGNKKINE